MEIILICIAIAIVLFVSAFIAKRRFGLLGLALAAGSLLSSIWGYDIGLMASGLGIPTTPLSTAVVMSTVILLPALVLLFHGYTYKNLLARLIGALMFMILAFAFLLDPLGRILMPTGFGVDVYNWLINNRDLIVGAGLICAVLDLFLTKPAQLADKKSKH
jgi:hypothetical protein